MLPEIVVEREVGDTLNLKPYYSPYLSLSSLPLTFGFTYGSYSDLSGISIKGGSPRGNAVYLNGILINQPQSSYADLTDISPFLFGKLQVIDGGFSPYSFYGNLNFKPSKDRATYGFVNFFLGFSAGLRDSFGGFDFGNLIGGKDTLTFFEGSIFTRSFWNLRFSRKRTSGMEGFPQSSGIQTDLRVLGSFGNFELLVLGREWKDKLVESYHTNFRFGRKFELWKFRFLGYLEGVKSSNIGSKIRPIVFLSEELSIFNGFFSWNVWMDKSRLGYGSHFNLPIKFFILSASISNRIPSFDELYWKGAQAEGNPKLKNEKSLTFTSELRYGDFYFSGFFRRIWDIIEWRNFGGIWRPENFSSGNIWGLSFGLMKKGIRFKYDRLYAYYDWGKRMIYRPRNSYNLNLSSKHLDVSMIYLDPRFSNQANTRFVDYVFKLDLYAKMQIFGFQLVFGAENITNRKNYFVEGYPSRGRTLVFSVFYKQL